MTVKPLEKPQEGSELVSRIEGGRESENISYFCSAVKQEGGKKN